MPNETALSEDDPRMIAWKAYKATPEFANTEQWARHISVIEMRGAGGPIGVPAPMQAISHPHVMGSLWAAFQAGYRASTEVHAGKQQAMAERGTAFVYGLTKRSTC